MKVFLPDEEQDFIRRHFLEWSKVANNTNTGISPHSYTSDIALVDVQIKPTFHRCLKMRRKKKIIINRVIATLRNPRTKVYKNCYPVSVDKVGSSNQSSKVDISVTFQSLGQT